MEFFVNLPLAWIYREEAWLDRFFGYAARNDLEHAFGLELGLDEVSLALPLSWHQKIAARILEQGSFCSVHLPFFMLPPGNVQNRPQGRKSLDILCRAAEMADIFAARHLIGHPGYSAATDASAFVERKGAAEGFPSEAWLDYSAAAWEKVAGIASGRLFLENTHESDPLPLLALLDRLTCGQNGRKIALCFDIGHWHCFAGGSALHNLEGWVKAFKPYLGHLHLHDNDGTLDQHLGLGCAAIPFGLFFPLLVSLNLYPSFTLEPHGLSDLDASLAWMGQNSEMRRWLACPR
ncbi:MAG: sugar phosphate isomerase/epimerase [Deltaproteobacteria bacterium]|jgi:sugar phosphate isomerase/epimerase|nr:sugar phosphate isomerase/epimerase [Deltaproteobacteria bacterium]